MEMIEIIDVKSSRWNEIIDGFQYKDVYFSSEFFEVSTSLDDGEPVLFYFESEHGKAAYPFLKRKIQTNSYQEELYDIVTPYGYGGPLYTIYDSSIEFSRCFDLAFSEYCSVENIVSEFIRFHPIIAGQKINRQFLEVVPIRHTIGMDLEHNGIDFMENIPSKTRNMIRKAMKHDIIIMELNGIGYLDEFIEIYTGTMSRNDATAYYYFSKEYFENLFSRLGNSIKMFGAFFEEKLISVTLIMCYGDFIHYHLSGAKKEYLYTGVNNLLLYEVAKWGSENNYKYFHLGGGYRGDDDSLFKFKKSFTKDGIYPFCVGKGIHNEVVYKELVNEKGIAVDTGFFPLYRSL